MSPDCGAHQPRRLGSRLMGFLLPEIYCHIKSNAFIATQKRFTDCAHFSTIICSSGDSHHHVRIPPALSVSQLSQLVSSCPAQPVLPVHIVRGAGAKQIGIRAHDFDTLCIHIKNSALLSSHLPALLFYE